MVCLGSVAPGVVSWLPDLLQVVGLYRRLPKVCSSLGKPPQLDRYMYDAVVIRTNSDGIGWLKKDIIHFEARW